MGKKGKRSRRKTVTAADRASVVAVETKFEELVVKISDSTRRNLYSQAVDELREGIQFIETKMIELSDILLKMNLETRFAERRVIFHSNLLMVEFSRHNFDSVIQIYENLFERGNTKVNMKILSPVFPTLQLQYHEALLRQGNGNIDTFISLSKLRISMKHDDTLESDLHRSADLLRTIKHFDAAIDLGKQLEELTGDKVSLVTTYLEQYTVGDKSLSEDFLLNMIQVMQKKHKNEWIATSYVASTLVIAQSTYLFHSSEEMARTAIGFIEKYLDMISRAGTHCITCKQTATTTGSQVQFVCSGCRVACYCSIDHQRLTWKKDAVRGLCIGHEVLCPVMKAYRKWTHANDKCHNERVSRLRRQFERECLYFLSDGLGLKDKCF